ncbi:MAG: DoxX family protein [Bdellovibrionota bacterium]
MQTKTIAAPIGRLFLSAIFIASGIQKLREREGTKQYMKSKNLPFVSVLLPAAAAVEMLGGASILSGARGKWGAGTLALFLVPTTLIFHDFWKYEGQEKQMQQINFFKNLAIMGGLVSLFAHGTKEISVDQIFDEKLVTKLWERVRGRIEPALEAA